MKPASLATLIVRFFAAYLVVVKGLIILPQLFIGLMGYAYSGLGPNIVWTVVGIILGVVLYIKSDRIGQFFAKGLE